uniref:Uncharacterized protein n=1 Tax=Nelumbo nucifera TaxID=4432 RepID=A0A822YY91_NELNU|nr:TPA_asm: hypothetical protein HUJ06_006805 [Nelumbo nucifera]
MERGRQQERGGVLELRDGGAEIKSCDSTIELVVRHQEDYWRCRFSF